MCSRCLFLVAILSLGDVVVPEASPTSLQCSGAASRIALEITIRSTRNASGEWITRLEGHKETDNRTDNLVMGFKKRVIECGEKQSFFFEGVFGEKPTEAYDGLLFHPKCGKNAAITNMGRSVEKLNGEERFSGVAYTNRPLRLNELFEVVVNKREGSKFGYFMGIGITTTAPDDGEIPAHMNSLKTGTWALYHNHVYHNGNLLQGNRKKNLDNLQVGDRIGLMITDSRTLLIFINGKEEAAASNVPSHVYGMFECFGDLSKVTLTS
ncbi:neuralized-like protein 4 [Hetaerina americana]|uniref:neuralized-like protein 4 n=1 Tax=Hetaerina americana TaxID=62018 RepID=UPI003A7F476F